MIPVNESADRLRSLPHTGCIVRADSGAAYVVIEHDQTGDATVGYAISRHGPLLRFVQTGYTTTNRMTYVRRCRITVARDPGYADDTVIFDDECESFGGVMPGAIACPDPRPRRRQRFTAAAELANIAHRIATDA